VPVTITTSHPSITTMPVVVHHCLVHFVSVVHLHAIDAGYSTAHEPSTSCQSETALPTSEESHAATPVSPSKGRRCSIPVVAPPIAPAMVGAVAVVWPIVRVAPIVILAIVVVSVIGLPIIVASVVGLMVVTSVVGLAIVAASSKIVVWLWRGYESTPSDRSVQSRAGVRDFVVLVIGSHETSTPNTHGTAISCWPIFLLWIGPTATSTPRRFVFLFGITTAAAATTTCTRRFVLLLWIATSPALTSATDPCSSRRLVFLLWIAATARLTLRLLVASKYAGKN